MKSLKLLILLLIGAYFVSLSDCKEQTDRDNSNSALVAVSNQDDNEDDGDGKVSDEGDSMDFSQEAANVFVPTKEWKKVEPGQSIPRGLHVRLNIQTGEREAKLLDDADADQPAAKESDHHSHLKSAMEEAMKELTAGKDSVKDSDLPQDLKYWKHAGKEGMINMKNSYFTHEELKEALKKFKVSQDDVQFPAAEPREKFRTIEEIRQDFKKLNMDMKSDLELLTEILKRYRVPDISHDEHLVLLTDLEYYLHQIDNAKNFADMGGLPLVLADLNSTFQDIRIEAALVLSSAVQSNPSVQVAAIEAGILQQLIRQLSTEPSVTCRSRLLTALSSLIRHFPYAQHKFVELGGLQALTDLLTRHGEGAGTEKLALKAVTLVNDLLTERLSATQETGKKDAVHKERIIQYAQVPLLESIVEHGWCELVPKLLAFPEHDAREKVLVTMQSLRESCRADFARHADTLESLRREYSELSAEEVREAGGNSDDENSDDHDGGVFYFGELLEHVNNVIADVKRTKQEL